MNQTLLIKKKKQEDDQEFLLKQKTKQANEMTDSYMNDVEYISKNVGEPEFISFLIRNLEVFLKNDLYPVIVHICKMVSKIPYVLKFEDQQYRIHQIGLAAALSLKVRAFHSFLRSSTTRKK